MKYLYLICRGLWQKLKRWQYRRIVIKANRLEESLTSLSREELNQRLGDLYNRARARKDIKLLIPMALAIGREYSQRVLKMRHYDVQLMGTMALYEGHIVEMDTGEGKTLMAPLAAFLHHLEDIDRCVHIVTANEYLAARDAQWMGPLYEVLGLSVGLIVPGQTAADRIRAYQKQVIYATAKDIVFDSLR